MRDKNIGQAFLFGNIKDGYDYVPISAIELPKEKTPVFVDVETYDPELKKLGAGYATGNGRVMGFAVFVEGEEPVYAVPEEELGGMESIKKFFMQVFKNHIFVSHNLQYDLGWVLREIGEDVSVVGDVYCTLVGSQMHYADLNSYSLNSMGEFLGEGTKNEAELEQRCMSAFKVKASEVKSNLWRLHNSWVEEYAKHDAFLCSRIYHCIRTRQKVSLKPSSEAVFREMEMQKALVAMKNKGVLIDVEAVKREVLEDKTKYIEEIEPKLNGASPWAAAEVCSVLEEQGVEVGRSDKGNPLLDKHHLAKIAKQNDFAAMVLEARRLQDQQKAAEALLESSKYNGYAHPNYRSLGARTGRFSSSKPNLQNVPRQYHKFMVAPEGKLFVKADYSQQEYRILAHFCIQEKVLGYEELLEAYKDKNVDFHEIVAQMMGVDRTTAKAINFGILYGMGVQSLADNLGISYDEAKAKREEHASKAPYAANYSLRLKAMAENVGIIKTLGGREVAFNKWEAMDWDLSKGTEAVQGLRVNNCADQDEVESEVQRCIEKLKAEGVDTSSINTGARRGWTYKALNYLIQGSAADQTKQACLDCVQAGFVPILQVHDELCFYVDREEQAQEIKGIMEQAIPLLVPSVVDVTIGKHW